MPEVITIENSVVDYHQGDDLVFHVATVLRDGSVQDLTGVVAITFTIVKTVNDSTNQLELSLGSGITVTDAPNGKFDITITPSDTANIIPEEYIFIVKVTPVNNKINTLIQGIFNLLGNI